MYIEIKFSNLDTQKKTRAIETLPTTKLIVE